jgi:Ca2+-binding RTX toxin-like protein
LAACVAAALALAPASASAVDVRVGSGGGEASTAAGNELILNGDGGSNQIAVSLTSDGTGFLIFNSGGFHAVYAPCTRVSQTQVRCPTAGVGQITSALDTGNDTFTIAPEVRLLSRIEGDEGLDTLNGGGGPDNLAGGAGADHVYGGRGADHLAGGLGKDVLAGGPGRDLLSGGPGVDTLRGGRGRDTLFGGPGADRQTQ